MSKPLIAIVGRPNVGKSMLFNKIIGRRLSIVEDTPGVTRDRIYGESDWNGRKFTLVDTGGIEPNTDNQILAFMRQQAQIAIDNATVIVLVTDIKTGMTAADQEVAGMLQRSKSQFYLYNKCGNTYLGLNPRNFSVKYIKNNLLNNHEFKIVDIPQILNGSFWAIEAVVGKDYIHKKGFP